MAPTSRCWETSFSIFSTTWKALLFRERTGIFSRLDIQLSGDNELDDDDNEEEEEEEEEGLDGDEDVTKGSEYEMIQINGSE